jgi:RNA 2',3'-cyclic 3'-phosphodiesterase
MARLFVAVWPTAEVIEALRALRRKDERGVRFVPPENWHVTLRFLGESHPDEVIERLDSIVLETAEARLHPAVDLLGRGQVIVPVSGTEGLARTVTGATRGLGEAPTHRRYVGHLTLARMRKDARPPRVTGTPFDESFEVTEVALVRSRLRSTGSEYETVATWPTRRTE